MRLTLHFRIKERECICDKFKSGIKTIQYAVPLIAWAIDVGTYDGLVAETYNDL